MRHKGSELIQSDRSVLFNTIGQKCSISYIEQKCSELIQSDRKILITRLGTSNAHSITGVSASQVEWTRR